MITAIGESPHMCACREAEEELGLKTTPADLLLTGLVSEHGYLGQSHWLMFLFELKVCLKAVPPAIGEGRFAFHPREKLDSLAMPETDREMLWPLFWKHRGGFFAAYCQSHPNGKDRWTIEESRGAEKP